MYKLLWYIVGLVCILYLISHYYTLLINKYFIKSKCINYDIYLEQYIQVISDNNYYMNYGLWDKDNMLLMDANINLANFMFDKINQYQPNAANKNILDIGCGYGDQDILWHKQLNDTCKITAIDISEKQINFACQNRDKQLIPKNKLVFDMCDAMNVHNKYKDQRFDTVICLESAFHYPNRPAFFKNVSTLLQPGGIFVIGDIVLNNNNDKLDYPRQVCMNLFMRVFSDFLNMQQDNLIVENEWHSHLSSAGFQIVEKDNITENTFIPYYNNFFKIYIKKQNLPEWISSTLISIFNYTQPFSYVIAVCKMK